MPVIRKDNPNPHPHSPPAMARTITRIFALLLLCLALWLPATTQAAGRVALVIGNSGYQELGELANPGRDAEAVARRLAGLGFTLLGADGKASGGAVHDLTQGQFFRALRRFADRAQGVLRLALFRG
ncbi:MAG: Caspase domain-containing protein [Candidatus Kentron sp. G]|nr:MAG: Caspase domain-containing protein [Candidatus Kentron sp. G]